MQTPVTIQFEFENGVERQLRYTVASTKRLIAKYGDVGKLLSQPKWELIPVIFEGLTEKTGVTVEALEDRIDLREMDGLAAKFFLAFTGKSVEDLTKQIIESAAKKSDPNSVPPATPTIQ